MNGLINGGIQEGEAHPLNAYDFAYRKSHLQMQMNSAAEFFFLTIVLLYIFTAAELYMLMLFSIF